jgi:hypothetical protein
MSKHTIDTESDAASDDLDTISGGTTDQFLIISPANASRTVVVKDGTGNITTGRGDISLDDVDSVVVLQYDGANWLVISSPVVVLDEDDFASDSETLPPSQQSAKAYISSVVSPWVAYTPTFTGFGTASSVSVFSRRNGDTLEIRGKFTSGTPTATEARIELGFNGTSGSLTSDSAKLPTGTSLAGYGNRSGAVASQYNYLIEPSVGYLTIGLQDGSNSGQTKQNADQIAANGVSLSFFASVPIDGW